VSTSRLAAILLVFTITALTACGGGGGSASSSDTAPPPSATEAASVSSDASLPPSVSADFSQVAVTATSSSASQAASLVPLAPVTNYTVSPLELILNGDFSNQLYFWGLADAQTRAVPSEIRSGGKALLVNSWAGQKLSATSLQPGKSYVLTVTARKTANTGTAAVYLTFHDKNTVTYRSSRRLFTSTWNAQYTLRFTAPAYTALADVAISVSGVQAIVDTVSLKMQVPIVQTEPVVSLAGSYVPAGYGLAFNDEFTGTALNRDKWFTRFIYDGGTRDHLNDEKQRYRDNNNHIVTGGLLNLVARKVSSSDPQGMNYESGMIRSDWTTRYGYIEARVKMPGALGLWPAFWLNPDVSEAGTAVWPPEIDIFEVVNNGVEDLPNMLHTSVVQLPGIPASYLYMDPSFVSQWTYWNAPFKFSDGWHTISAEWTPTTVTTFVDGKKIMTKAYEWKDGAGQLAGPAHILLNLAVGGSWAGRHGIDDASFPQALQIDWVRAYKKLN